jgi:hypothetical protein
MESMIDSTSDFRVLDRQLACWANRLVNELGIEASAAAELGSSIAREVAALDQQVRLRLRESQPVRIADRLAELIAFQGFMDSVHATAAPPTVVRAQVIVQNYVCFVYLGESCFRELRKLPLGTTKRCCAFLTDNPVRAFRNAIAHANWRYTPDFSGLEFWARKGASLEEPPVRWDVSQEDLNFWQAVARCTAYAAYSSL